VAGAGGAIAEPTPPSIVLLNDCAGPPGALAGGVAATGVRGETPPSIVLLNWAAGGFGVDAGAAGAAAAGVAGDDGWAAPKPTIVCLSAAAADGVEGGAAAPCEVDGGWAGLV
jgi:hypothetical protein